ncbi:uncharacterized protein LOC129756973 [Uranotaenia lowii]|uniref:uncharacterized protein LOC129749062 n=1 Tax=Uranotaenia lowii TaxID=190385 RepID=UPI00247A00A8|nr:uncharacterized protein LOC129749062 [Uranotaenia lowii]XP_055607836.1 uncharacterized protein LOC129755403 [Uranotaenia lowii]XP_055607837.1 uncharacterized protein LOC129755403 [Uranotaenia lowii]XP_055607838.1 uncharacterized protein LOC129755403 [Uranotaenia lowii]XP_055607839.1 uncharacterized protein LOC129755403 [Uranotaenia lowii]XP_055610025.1 uncharacterized protein LOC129756973 [Uranotaenia lowii]XP_055610026.1 uncharacterized protein LOC129756973 [Uranotaenia lowii]XP_05561002
MMPLNKRVRVKNLHLSINHWLMKAMVIQMQIQSIGHLILPAIIMLANTRRAQPRITIIQVKDINSNVLKIISLTVLQTGMSTLRIMVIHIINSPNLTTRTPILLLVTNSRPTTIPQGKFNSSSHGDGGKGQQSGYYYGHAENRTSQNCNGQADSRKNTNVSNSTHFSQQQQQHNSQRGPSHNTSYATSSGKPIQGQHQNSHPSIYSNHYAPQNATGNGSVVIITLTLVLVPRTKKPNILQRGSPIFFTTCQFYATTAAGKETTSTQVLPAKCRIFAVCIKGLKLFLGLLPTAK